MIDYIFGIPFSLDFEFNKLLFSISALVMVATCIRLVMSKSLLSSVILLSVFSLFIGICYLFLDAPDVAMTETALGTCLSTCVLLNIIKIVGEETNDPNEKVRRLRVYTSFILCSVFFVCLCWISYDLPEFGSLNSPIQNHVSKYYLDNTKAEIGIPSFVAAILASYRGFDTLGETTVILIAGLGVLLILNKKKKNETGKL